ncbi:MAG: M81 family metallopeptidase [Acidimicrobiia bacterium]
MPGVVVCGLIHESNAFAADVTPLDAFVRLGGGLGGFGEGSGTEVGGTIAGLREAGATPVTTTMAWAQSSGPVADDAAEALVSELVDGAAAAVADGAEAVVACLHGSMCAVSDGDVEGTALTSLRAALPAGTPVVATLDWHCSITERMVEAADALVVYRTYPHIDQEARGREAAALALRLLDGVGAHAAWRHPPLLLAGPATRHDAPAMAAVLRRAEELAADERVLTWSVGPGFARSDNAATGAHVYALATEPDAAHRLVAEVAEVLWASREAFLPDTEPATPALLDGAADRDAGPLVLSDQGDNPGGGAAGDGTTLLALLEAHGPEGSVVASLHDTAAVDACVAAGEGAVVDLAVGGHTDDRHGPTLPVTATVEVLADGRYTMRSPTHPNVPVRIGPTARIRTEAGTVVVLTSSRVQNLDVQLLEHVGIDPAAAPVIAVKSNAHFRAAYEPIARRVVDVDTPGLSTPHLERLPYRRLPRPIFPLDPDTTWSAT